MAALTGDSARAALRAYLERQPRTFLLEEGKGTAPAAVVELATGKRLRFAFGQVLTVEEDRSPASGSRYLRVALDDGRSFALAGIGIVFAPVFTSTGPLPDCPAAASSQDFTKLLRHLEHLVEAHEDEHQREALQVLMVLLAFLDGARAVGLEVDREERALEPLLDALERRRAPPEG